MESHSGVTNLLSLNVSKHVEKKNGLSYLSWAWAWDQALRADPNASFAVRTFGDKCWMDVHGTAMVWVDVTMFGKTQQCFLPVMDHRNKPISDPDAFQINTALMRCLTKCLALFGLGLYIYAGEDLPFEDDEPKAEIKTESKEPPVNEKKSLEAFAEGMLHYLEINKTQKGLRSYWKSNQTTLDRLKVVLPDVYADILEKFKAKKESLPQEDA